MDRLYKMSTEMCAIEFCNLRSSADLTKNKESENFIKMCLKAYGNGGIKGSKNRWFFLGGFLAVINKKNTDIGW